jgi:hypothetical protein
MHLSLLIYAQNAALFIAPSCIDVITNLFELSDFKNLNIKFQWMYGTCRNKYKNLKFAISVKNNYFTYQLSINF